MLDDKVSDLVYADSEVVDVIKQKWPDATFVDASDFIHSERFEVKIDTTWREFFIHALDCGYSDCSLRFQLEMGGHHTDPDFVELVKKWLAEHPKETK